MGLRQFAQHKCKQIDIVQTDMVVMNALAVTLNAANSLHITTGDNGIATVCSTVMIDDPRESC